MLLVKNSRSLSVPDLVKCFLVFTLRFRIFNNAAADIIIKLPIFNYKGPITILRSIEPSVPI